jgi:hypothetical protein
VVTEPEQDELERLLAAVADEHRTVIMTSVNEAWAAQDSLLDLFLESFRAGERIAHFADHLLVVALDAGALKRCRAVHPHCYLLPAAAAGRNLSDAKVFMSKDYIDLVWSKVRLQQRILELGYNFLFTVRRVPITREPAVGLGIVLTRNRPTGTARSIRSNSEKRKNWSSQMFRRTLVRTYVV